MTLLASGIVDLGLTVRDCLALTPRHLDYLSERFLDRERRETRRTCYLVASVHNMFCSEEDRITEDDLMTAPTETKQVEKWAESQAVKFANFNLEAEKAGAPQLIKKWVPNG